MFFPTSSASPTVTGCIRNGSRHCLPCRHIDYIFSSNIPKSTSILHHLFHNQRMMSRYLSRLSYHAQHDGCQLRNVLLGLRFTPLVGTYYFNSSHKLLQKSSSSCVNRARIHSQSRPRNPFSSISIHTIFKSNLNNFSTPVSTDATKKIPLELKGTSSATATDDKRQDEDTPESKYLELVTQTADRMRSAVRAYVAEYYRHCGELPGDKVSPKHVQHSIETSKTFRPTPSPIKLVGILATATTANPPHPTDVSRPNHSCNCDTDTHGNERYSEQISTFCAADGITYEPWRVPPTREALERAIHHANERSDVHGILVFYPVFDKLMMDGSAGDGTRGAEMGGFGGIGKANQASNVSRGPYKRQTTGVYYKLMDDYFRDLVVPSKDVEGYCRKSLRIRSDLEDQCRYYGCCRW